MFVLFWLWWCVVGGVMFGSGRINWNYGIGDVFVGFVCLVGWYGFVFFSLC